MHVYHGVCADNAQRAGDAPAAAAAAAGCSLQDRVSPLHRMIGGRLLMLLLVQ